MLLCFFCSCHFFERAGNLEERKFPLKQNFCSHSAFLPKLVFCCRMVLVGFNIQVSFYERVDHCFVLTRVFNVGLVIFTFFSQNKFGAILVVLCCFVQFSASLFLSEALFVVENGMNR